MKIIDARSGEVMSVGDRVDYPGGEFVRLLRVDGDRALLERRYRDFSQLPPLLPGQFDIMLVPLVEDAVWVPLAVRRGDHSSYPGQDVAFIPS